MISHKWNNQLALSNTTMKFDCYEFFPQFPTTIEFVVSSSILPFTEHQIIDYRALSYTWGAKFAPEPIVVNGKRLTVSKNLPGALKRLRSQLEDEDQHFLG